MHKYGGCGIMSRLYEDRLLVDPYTYGVRRAHNNSDLACVAWSSGTHDLGHDVHSGFSNHSRLPMAKFFHVAFLFLPFLDHNMRQPKITTYMLPPKPHSLVYFEETQFYQPIMDFPFEHPNISKKNILYQEWYGGVTW